VKNMREPCGGRYFAILNVEGEGDPIAMFMSQADADAYLTYRRALPEDHDDRLTEYHQVFPCDVVGAWWNSYDSDPRADSPLHPEEVMRVHGVRCRGGDADEACGDRHVFVHESTGTKFAQVCTLSTEHAGDHYNGLEGEEARRWA